MLEPKTRSRSDSDGSKSPSSSSSWDAHSKSQKRQWVISELEQIFAQYGNPLPKNSVAVEARLFETSRTQVEYLALARRLIYTTAEMAKNIQLDAEKAEKASKAGHWKMDQKKRYLEEEDAANSLLAMANQEEPSSSSQSHMHKHPNKVFNEPSPFLRRPPVIVANVPPQPQEESRRRIDFGLIHLPHLKRPIETAAPVEVPAKRRKTSSVAQDALEVVMDDEEEDTESEDGRRTELSVNQTYEATITVFIPMGYSIGRINVALRKNAENEE